VLVLLVLLRFGLAGVMAPVLDAHLQVPRAFFRSLWTQKGVEFRVALQPPDAPGLFLTLQRLCTRAGVEMPNEVFLEMNMNAWVRLRGYRRGAGRTLLGVGYDLLAGLSEPEVEAVLAHEMMHAKRVQRG
jgi:Zn-dependent protease with chaperone function